MVFDDPPPPPKKKVYRARPSGMEGNEQWNIPMLVHYVHPSASCLVLTCNAGLGSSMRGGERVRVVVVQLLLNSRLIMKQWAHRGILLPWQLVFLHWSSPVVRMRRRKWIVLNISLHCPHNFHSLNWFLFALPVCALNLEMMLAPCGLTFEQGNHTTMYIADIDCQSTIIVKSFLLAG